MYFRSGKKLISQALCFPPSLILVSDEGLDFLYSSGVFSSLCCVRADRGAVSGHFSSADLTFPGVGLCEWPDCRGPERIFDRFEFDDSHPWRRYQVSLRRIN